MIDWVRLGGVGLVTLAIGCGGGSAESEEVIADPEPAPDATSGGEGQPEPAEMRYTTPIPVPQPAVERDAMSAALQALWDRVELAVAVRPPEPPAEATADAISAWASGPFAEFITRRREAVAHAEAAIAGVRSLSGIERGVAAALLGYVYEDGAASIRGAPVPEAIGADPEMLEVYTTTVDEVVAPIALASASAYGLCVGALREAAPWRAWAEYCDSRGLEVVRVYRVPTEGAATSSSPSSSAEPPPAP
jgi:hypothetical protein